MTVAATGPNLSQQDFLFPNCSVLQTRLHDSAGHYFGMERYVHTAGDNSSFTFFAGPSSSNIDNAANIGWTYYESGCTSTAQHVHQGNWASCAVAFNYGLNSATTYSVWGAANWIHKSTFRYGATGC